MKKTYRNIFILTALSMVLFALGCGKKKHKGDTGVLSPGEFVVYYFDEWEDENFEKVASMTYEAYQYPDSTMQRFLTSLKKGRARLQENHQGIDEIEVIAENYNEDSTQATVRYQVEYGNRTAQELTRKIYKIENNWYLSL